MKQITKNILFFILVAFWVVNVSVNAQDGKCIADKKVQDERFIAEVIQSLDETNPLRVYLRYGKQRGDGIHQDWMDEMKKFGIKQVTVIMNFEWKDNKVKSIAIKEVSYYSEYYSRDDVEIKDQKVLQQIKDSGLQKKLENAAIARAEKNLLNVMKSVEESNACGILPLDFLDDERLPFISIQMPEIDSDECPKNSSPN